MEDFVQSSEENGVVVFSLGSMVSNLTEERANVIASALAQIPQKVRKIACLVDISIISFLDSEKDLTAKTSHVKNKFLSWTWLKYRMPVQLAQALKSKFLYLKFIL
jgi:hypothetical protein